MTTFPGDKYSRGYFVVSMDVRDRIQLAAVSVHVEGGQRRIRLQIFECDARLIIGLISLTNMVAVRVQNDGTALLLCQYASLGIGKIETF